MQSFENSRLEFQDIRSENISKTQEVLVTDSPKPTNTRNPTSAQSPSYDMASIDCSVVSIGSCLTLESQNSTVTYPKYRTDSLNNILEDSSSVMSFRNEMNNLKNSNILNIQMSDENEAMKSYYSQYDDVFASANDCL